MKKLERCDLHMQLFYSYFPEINSLSGISQAVICYFLLINIAAFVAFGWDKRKARLHQWRIPEAQLLLLAALGGSVGAFAGMRIFHHKTRKPKFYVGIPVIFIIQAVLLGYLCNL